MIAFSIVLLKKFRLPQVLIPIALFIAMSILESRYKPIINTKDRIVSTMTKYLFSIILVIYLSIVLVVDSINLEQLNLMFGYPLIGLYCLVMATNIYPMLHNLFYGPKTLFVTLSKRKSISKVSDASLQRTDGQKEVGVDG